MKELDAKVIFNDGYFSITNETAPPHIRSLAFQDEYEANFIWASWLQFTKFETKTPSNTLNGNYNQFQWIIKALFRIIGVASRWSE